MNKRITLFALLMVVNTLYAVNHYLYLPKSYFPLSGGSNADVHKAFNEENSYFTMSYVDAGGDKVYGVFSSGYMGNGGGSFLVEVLVGDTYEQASFVRTEGFDTIWEWTAPPPPPADTNIYPINIPLPSMWWTPTMLTAWTNNFAQ